MRRSGIDWAGIRADYETGAYTIKQLAEDYEVTRVHIHRKAKEEGWVQAPRPATVLAAKKKQEQTPKVEVDDVSGQIIAENLVLGNVTHPTPLQRAQAIARVAETITQVEERHQDEWREIREEEEQVKDLVGKGELVVANERVTILKKRAEVMALRQDKERKAHRIDFVQEGVLDMKRQQQERAMVFEAIVESLDRIAGATSKPVIDAKPDKAENAGMRSTLVDAVLAKDITPKPEETGHE